METLASRITTRALGQMAPFEGKKRYASAQIERCPMHGEYTAMLIRGAWSGCPDCMNVEDQVREAEQRAAWRQELKAREWSAKLGRAAIPERFADRRLESYRPDCPGAERALAVATRYAENFEDARATGACLIFAGDVGTGKTHLAVGIAHHIMGHGRQAVFTSVMRAVRSVKETYAKGAGRTEAQAIRDLVEPDLLILDEVGVQHGSDTEKLILFEIINGRYEAARPTIVISNLDAAGLEQFLGERAFDRLRESGGRLVVFDWASHRGKRPSVQAANAAQDLPEAPPHCARAMAATK